MSNGQNHRLRIEKRIFQFKLQHVLTARKPLHTTLSPFLSADVGQLVMHSARRVLAGQPVYVGVSATVIAGEQADQLFVECRMFVQVKAPKQTLGRARRRAPQVKRAPKAQAHAVRLAGRFNHVENNSAVKTEKKEMLEIVKRDNGLPKAVTVSQA